MATTRTIPDINQKIRDGSVTVWTVEEAKANVAALGLEAATAAVDVVTTGTFEPMESSGAVINLGHTDPPINIRECYLDSVLAYAGFGAVDLYLGASQAAGNNRWGESSDSEVASERGGGHVIAQLIAGKSVPLRAIGQVSDCYPRATLDISITRDTINQFYLFNPRNLYQNFIVGVNSSDRPLLTYLGPLQPFLGNAVYANSGALSPMLNDPQMRTLGIGSRIFIGGAPGYIAWEGTQHFPLQKRLPNHTPIGPSATVALIGDAKQMQPEWVRGCYFSGYGPSLMLGVGVPIPVLDAAVLQSCAISDQDIVAPVIDFSIPRRVRPSFGLVSYQQLKSGRITINGSRVRTAPLSSLYLGRRVAATLKNWIINGDFELSEPVAPLPQHTAFLPQNN
ncbi:homocysteine biosynthesis protein [Leptolyngbya cf. ectocarpi LEGE 11479]|uniref:Homocysteine biosynthesis protein n=1 Tax=Leptolyngbya cf. ectocarpi LEGE 11479 TaxID=1828722 RepID=A0A928ZY44_LEPEC|nr:homocysteine biosynthesis protein [Leptolyngbya ectocarpi]MBE9069568.1 homocysteine biosynthesis protein [Leptolyngbya cf. ectocarpi LEGE 11479]